MKDIKVTNYYQGCDNLDWKFKIGDRVIIKDNLKYGDVINGMMVDENVYSNKSRTMIIRDKVVGYPANDNMLYYVIDIDDMTPYNHTLQYRLYVADMLDKVDDIISKDDDYYNDIIDCIQCTINNIVHTKYSDDPCKPQFLVSILNESENSQKIILSCTHLENSFSRVLFPRKDSFYGYDSLGDMVESLYNQTM